MGVANIWANIFGELVDIQNITIHTGTRAGKTVSLYAIMKADDQNEDDILKFNGIDAGGRSLVVEKAKERDESNTDGENRRQSQRKTSHSHDQRRVCRFYIKGTCNRDNCRYDHPEMCRNFQNTGQCRFGQNCRFVHIHRNSNHNSLGKHHQGADILTKVLRALVPQLGGA